MKINSFCLICLFALAAFVATGFASAHAQLLDPGDGNASAEKIRPVSDFNVVRAADGSIRLMGQSQASRYCQSHGQHLPTVREFAKVLEQFGVAPIVESIDHNSERPPRFYGIVRSVNEDGSKDAFYFNSMAAQSPSGDAQNAIFWSNSFDSAQGDYAFTVGFYKPSAGTDAVSMAESGNSVSSMKHAVLCVE